MLQRSAIELKYKHVSMVTIGYILSLFFTSSWIQPLRLPSSKTKLMNYKERKEKNS